MSYKKRPLFSPGREHAMKEHGALLSFGVEKDREHRQAYMFIKDMRNSVDTYRRFCILKGIPYFDKLWEAEEEQEKQESV